MAILGAYYLNAITAQSGTISTSSHSQEVPSSTTTFTATPVYTITSTAPMPSGPGQLDAWNSTTSYLTGALPASCVTEESFIYCIGGSNFLNTIYFASLTPSGIGLWSRTTDYPTGIQDQSCVSSTGYIYCVGGHSARTGETGKLTAAVYYATLSPSGIGRWARTTPFLYADDPRCMTSGGYIYCMTAPHNGTRFLVGGLLYSAPIIQGGALGSWSQASPSLPFTTSACSASGGYGYCYGGGSCSPGGRCTSPSYFGQFTQSGHVIWNSTTAMPDTGYAVYAASDSFAYYFSGPNGVLFARLSPQGIGPWENGRPYPRGFPTACVGNGNYIYCIGGYLGPGPSYAGSAYFARISP